MLDRRFRRRWMWAAAPFAALLLAGCPGGEDDGGGDLTDATDTAVTEPTTAPPLPGTTGNVRREINTFSAAEIDAYRKGVALMKSRPATDPTSWIYQANMHDVPDSNQICAVTPGPPQEAWATCQHGNFFFLAWHRMYLYYFERILRAAVREATGDPNQPFSLPFWDYENPDNHDLPEAFRNPANTSNPLFVAKRATNCNNGGLCVSAAAASAEVAMDPQHTNFCSCPSGESCPGCVSGLFSDETFGSGFTAQPEHYGNETGELEQQPHNVVHGTIGGPGGWMSYLECAARDPIFWLHHANIDRLWQVWLNLGGRANPLGNDEWKTQQFTFFDENKQKVVMTGCQILNTLSQLDYEYEGVPVNNAPLCDAPGPILAAPPPPPAATTLAAGAPAQVQLGREPVAVSVAVPQPARERVLAAAAPGGRSVRLVIEGLRLLRPGVPYQVYLNLPQGAEPDPEGPHFVGHVAFFSRPEHAQDVTRTFDIAEEVQALRAAGQWTGDVRVTFVPAHTEGVLAAAGAQPFISFRKVSIVER